MFLVLFILPHILNFGMGQHFSTLSEQVSENHGDPIHVFGVQCPEQTLVGSYGTFNFPASNATLEGTPVIMPCPFGVADTGAEVIFPSSKILPPIPGAELICKLINDPEKGYIGKWVVLDSGSGCRTEKLHSTTVSIRNIFINSPTITVHNVRQAPTLLLQLLEYSLKDYASASTLIESIGRVLETSEIFTSDPEDPIMTTIKEKLLGYIELYALHVSLNPGERILLETSSVKVESVLFPDSSVPVSTYGFESLTLSNEAISMGRENSEMGKARLQMTAYSNDLFYHWGEERDWRENSSCSGFYENETSGENTFGGKWRIISLYFNGVAVENLTQPIVYNFPVESEESLKWVCVYWDTEEKKWSSRGMRTLTFAHSIRCESSHLTAFSALLDPNPTGYNPGRSSNTSSSISSLHLHILSVLSSVGSALSITGLAVTSLTYGLFRCMRKERSNKILLQLCISLLFLHLMSMSSERDMWSNYCAVPALLLHYFLLSSLAWMLVEGVHMYQLLISVFVKPETRFLLKRFICAYGLPLLIVGISGAIDMDAYSEGREETCMMAGHMPLYLITYLGPVAIILGTNTFIFARIFQVLCKQTSKTKQQFQNSSSSEIGKCDEKKQSNNNPFADKKMGKRSSSSNLLSPVQIKGAITVMLLLGVGWILGLFAIGPFQLVFRYLFCICNAGQGVFIFLFRVLLYPQACRTWRRAVLGSSSLDSESGFSSAGRRGKSRPSFSISPTFISGTNSVENSLTRSDPLSAKLANAILASIIQQESEKGNVIKEEETKHY